MDEFLFRFRKLSVEERKNKKLANSYALNLFHNENCHTQRLFLISKDIFNKIINSDIEFNLTNLYIAAAIMLPKINDQEIIKLNKFDYDVIYCLLFFFFELTINGTSSPLLQSDFPDFSQ